MQTANNRVRVVRMNQHAFEDLTGRTFGRLRVVSYAGMGKHRHHLWSCDCACGNGATVIGTLLKRGDTSSCGCLRRERRAAGRSAWLQHCADVRANVALMADRFWAKADQSGGYGSCWSWQGTLDASGYGKITIGGKHGRPRRAHRIAWELAHGSPPRGCIRHRCDNPRCVNPAHLDVGTIADNNRDMWERGRGKAPRRSKLSPAQVREIRAAFARGGVSYRGLGRDYGVRGSTIARIVTGEGWRDVQ